MEQKQVKLIGLRVQNNGIIQAAELTPDLLQKRLVLITGETGNGKSTLLNSAKIATAGTDAIKKSDALPDGFVAEALLRDGDIPIYIGVKTDTYTRGEHQGEQNGHREANEQAGKIDNQRVADDPFAIKGIKKAGKMPHPHPCASPKAPGRPVIPECNLDAIQRRITKYGIPYQRNQQKKIQLPGSPDAPPQPSPSARIR